MYLKIPIDFDRIMQKKELDITTLEHSIAQQLILIATTYFGECKFDETFGCDIWNMDFDFLMNENTLKKTIATALKDSIKMHESRLHLEEIEVEISEKKMLSSGIYRTKKKIDIYISGKIIETNRPFKFNGYFFVGPLSY
ncbi:GPW/gp25 family protein [uncultured Flavobacterium sp.]|uniref:GPW/gp25 family protein n=1 Tax=uncultured Flavobacterium sp. TaxID=165435 RepID=UPI0025DDD7B2|nr:GPW/gp25 family protein [uncultured Flavobacterium sp.]